jgi:hypothetical protein
MIFERSSDELEKWLDSVMSGKIEPHSKFIVREDEIEG